MRNCVDFVQLNWLTKKDLYLVPCAKGPQQKLAGKTVFSKVDLKSANGLGLHREDCFLPRTWIWALGIYSDWSNPDLPGWLGRPP